MSLHKIRIIFLEETKQMNKMTHTHTRTYTHTFAHTDPHYIYTFTLVHRGWTVQFHIIRIKKISSFCRQLGLSTQDIDYYAVILYKFVLFLFHFIQMLIIRNTYFIVYFFVTGIYTPRWVISTSSHIVHSIYWFYYGAPRYILMRCLVPVCKVSSFCEFWMKSVCYKRMKAINISFRSLLSTNNLTWARIEKHIWLPSFLFLFEVILILV